LAILVWLYIGSFATVGLYGFIPTLRKLLTDKGRVLKMAFE